MKIKVLFQLNELAFGGTTKGVLTFCKYLDRKIFDPYLFYHSERNTLKYYRHKIESFLSIEKKQRFENLYSKNLARLIDFENLLGKEHIFSGTSNDFLHCLKSLKPDVVNFNRGVEQDWYTQLNLPKNTVYVETNIFGKSSNSKFLNKISRHFFVSQWLKDQAKWCNEKGRVLYNPILKPAHDNCLVDKPPGLIIGRISRPGLDSGENVLKIFSLLKTPATLLVIGAGEALLAAAKTNADGTNKNIICLPPTTNESELSQFYNSIDLLLHYRQEGETFGMNIAEAMIHGKTAVSHKSYLDNAQCELLQDCGFVVNENDFPAQAEKIDELLQDDILRQKLNKLAKLKAMQNFEAEAVTKVLQAHYLQLLEEK